MEKSELKKIGNIIFWVVVVALALIAAFTFYSKNKPRDLEVKPLVAKITAPDFTLTNMQGKSVRLSDYKGKVVFVNFWASWCPPCKAEMSGLDKAAKTLEKEGNAVLLTLNLTDGSRETQKTATDFIKANNYSMEVLFDNKGSVFEAYLNKMNNAQDAIPTTFIIKRDGTIYNFVQGPISEATILSLSRGL